jgi:hypothetical protein
MKALFRNTIYKRISLAVMFGLGLMVHSTISAQTVLFDFDNIPAHTPFPVSQAVSGVTARFTGTGEGYSIQAANVLGFTPAGFSGNVIYPNSIYLADLLINFDQKITDFSIMYSCQELGCDDAATMRVTAFYKGSQVATNTKIASFPGTWPVDTLRCSYAQGFDSLVVHYDKRPPTCRDYGVIFLTDNMRVTPFKTSIAVSEEPVEKFTVTNPVSGNATISLSLTSSEHINITVFDMSGKAISDIYNGYLPAGENTLNWTADNSIIKRGMYLVKVSGENTVKSKKVIVE